MRSRSLLDPRGIWLLQRVQRGRIQPQAARRQVAKARDGLILLSPTATCRIGTAFQLWPWLRYTEPRP